MLLLTMAVICCYGADRTITNDNWRDMLQGEWMVKFYAPWCPACQGMSHTWKELGMWASKDMTSLSVGSVDVTQQAELNGRFMVTSLPTIYHVKDGVFRQYSSSRSLKDFKDFIIEEKWKPIKPMSSYLSPDSFVMNGVSKLFSFSMNLKTFHESLRSDYGLPGWASMLLFGLAVVVIGLLLGIGLVLFIDWFMGPQPEIYEPQPTPLDEIDATKENKIKENEEDEEEENAEEVKDDEEVNQDKSVRKRKVKKAD